MTDRNDSHERALEMLLAGCPDRVRAAIVPLEPADQAALDADAEALASLALSLEPPAPLSEAVRVSLSHKLDQLPDRPRQRVLLVMDMIRDYLTPGRALFVPRARDIVVPLAELLSVERARGTPIVYLCDEHDADDPELHVWPSHGVRGTDGPEVISELAPEPHDIVLGHRTYSAFRESNLENVLRGLHAEELVFTGCATEVGILATATDALMRGFTVSTVPGCHAGTSETAENVAIAVLGVLRPVRPHPTSTPTV